MNRELTQRGKENPKVCRSGRYREQLLPPGLRQSTRGKTDVEERPAPPKLVAYLGCVRRIVKILAEVLLWATVGKQEAILGGAAESPEAS